MAGVLEHRFVRLRPDVLAGPRRFPSVRVLHREVVQQGVLVDAREPLYHLQIARSADVGGRVVEVGGLDDQRVAVPPADGVAGPTAHVVRRVFAVDAHDAGVVNHFRENHHMARRLHDALVVVVQRRQHRRPGGGAEAEQAAVRQRAAFRIVVRARPVVLHPPRGAVVLVRVFAEAQGAAPLRLRRHGRNAAVRRVDDDGRAVLAVDLEVLLARINPEAVVAADVARCAAGAVAPSGRRFPIRSEILGTFRERLRRLPGGELGAFFRQELLVAAPLQRGDGRGVVVAGEIRLAVRRARDVAPRHVRRDHHQHSRGHAEAKLHPGDCRVASRRSFPHADPPSLSLRSNVRSLPLP